FIESILSFSSSYPGFFLTKLSIIEGNTENSLRFLHGQLNDLLNNLSQSSDFTNIQNILRRIGDKILIAEAPIPQIFGQTTTSNAIIKIKEFIARSISNHNEILFSG